MYISGVIYLPIPLLLFALPTMNMYAGIHINAIEIFPSSSKHYGEKLPRHSQIASKFPT